MLWLFHEMAMIRLNELTLEPVKTFKYVGGIIKSDEKQKEDMKMKI